MDAPERLGRLVVGVRVPIVATALLLTAAGALYGGGAAAELVDGGYTPPDAESARASAILARDFGAGTPDLVLVAQSDRSVDAPDAVAAGLRLTARLRREPGVISVRSYWTGGPSWLRSDDGRAALVAVVLAGSENDALNRARALVPSVTGVQGPLRVRATGQAEVDREVQQQSEEDLRRAELLAAPAVAIILLLAFGSVVAAALPLVVGAVSVAGTLALLRLLAAATPVSLFAMNVATALSFGLAVDYGLLIVSRFREELDRGQPVPEALGATLRTAGRTVLFSALTVALAAGGLLVFPLYFLRSLGWAAVAVVLFSALAALLVLPAVLALLGGRVGRLNPLRPLGVSGRTYAESKWWRWLALRATRRPVVLGGLVTAVLVLLAAPLAHARFALDDERVLPADAQAHLAGDAIRAHFPAAALAPVEVVVPGGASGDYARQLARLPGVARVERVDAPAGTWFALVPAADPGSPAAERLVHDVRSQSTPPRPLVGGLAAAQVDVRAAIADRLPQAAALILGGMALLLLLLSGSPLVAIKAIALSLLSLAATCGALVFVFQDGHLRGLAGDFTVTGQLDIAVPILVACLAFGLSVDYEVFLVARIREEYAASGDNTRAVVTGLARTGRLFSAAALAVATVMIALATSANALLEFTGAGLALAVLMDAALVRGVLVPAFMRLAGGANWWAPALPGAAPVPREEYP
jgi:putative drug exporter of the RND superfamily